MNSIVSKVPALPIAICLAVGIAIGYFWCEDVDVRLTVGLSIAGFALYIIQLFRQKQAIWFLATAAVFFGMWSGKECVPRPFPENIQTGTGVLWGKVTKIDYADAETRIFVDATRWQHKDDSIQQDVNFGIVTNINHTVSSIFPGSIIRLAGSLRPLDHTTDLPYEPDYNRFLYLDGAVARLSGFPSPDFSVDNSQVSSFQKVLSDLRYSWLSSITTAGFDESVTTFLLAAIGGDDTLVSDDMEQQFQETGIAHILAISGIHIAIILMVFSLLLYPVKLIPRLRMVYFIVLAVFVLLYAMITGSSPSACRAAIMCSVILIGKVVERRGSLLQSLSLAVIILLCIKPLWLFTPGFQFSVCAVLSIVVFMPLLTIFSNRHPFIRSAWVTIMFPVIAVAGTLVLTLYYFQSFAFSFWISNIWSTIFVPFIIGLGFLGCFLNLFGITSGLLAWITDHLYNIMTDGIRFIAKLIPDSHIPVFINTTTLFLIILSIIIVACLIRTRFKNRLIIGGSLIIALLWFVPRADAELPRSEIYIPRSHSGTKLIVVTNGKSYQLSTSQNTISDSLEIEYTSKRYKNFFNNRGVPSHPTLIQDGICERDIQYNSNILTINNTTFLWLDENFRPNSSQVVDYIIVTERFKRDIVDIVNHIATDTVLLSKAIQHSRHKKLMFQLDTLGINYRSLREEGFALQKMH